MTLKSQYPLPSIGWELYQLGVHILAKNYFSRPVRRLSNSKSVKTKCNYIFIMNQSFRYQRLGKTFWKESVKHIF